jgi:hypothetical protein
LLRFISIGKGPLDRLIDIEHLFHEWLSQRAFPNPEASLKGR